MTSVDDNNNNNKPDECEAETTGPAPTQDEVIVHSVHRYRMFVMFQLVLLGLGVVIAIVAVVIKFGVNHDDPVTASSTSTPETNPDDPVTTSMATDFAETNPDDPVMTSSTATPEIDNVEIPVLPSIWKQQGEANIDTTGYATSVALSADASTIAVASWVDPVQVLRADDDGEYTVLIGQEMFAHAVDISADGKTMICASQNGVSYTGSRSDYDGYVQVFSLESDNVLGTVSWKQIGQDIIGTLTGAEFGKSVSISKDGKTIAAGSGYIYNYSTGLYDSGPVRIYRLAEDGMSWEQIGEDIYGESHGSISTLSDSVLPLSLSPDGSTIAIGDPMFATDTDRNSYGDSAWFGQVTVYRYDSGGGSWEQLGQNIYGDNASDQLGSYVQLSDDGNIIAIGVAPYPYLTTAAAYVRVYSLSSSDDDTDITTWKQIGQDFGANGCEYDRWPFSLSDDGKTLAVGDPYAIGDNVYESVEVGLVTVYRMDDLNSGWMQLGDPIKGEEVPNEHSGCLVLLSADGNKVAIGYTKDGDNTYLSPSNDYLRIHVLG